MEADIQTVAGSEPPRDPVETSCDNDDEGTEESDPELTDSCWRIDTSYVPPATVFYVTACLLTCVILPRYGPLHLSEYH